MQIPRIKSAPALLEHVAKSGIGEEALKQIQKSVSYQILSELTQLTVDDIKTTNNILTDLGSNANELMQSSVDYIEEESPTKNVFLNIGLRLLVGEFVNLVHNFLLFIYHIFLSVNS